MHLKNLMSMSLQKATYLVPTIRLHIFHTFANQISKKLKFVRFERKFWKLFLNFGQKSISKLNFNQILLTRGHRALHKMSKIRSLWEKLEEGRNFWREASFVFPVEYVFPSLCRYLVGRWGWEAKTPYAQNNQNLCKLYRKNFREEGSSNSS